LNETIVGFAVGGNRSFALTSNGRVFAWGVNHYQSLGDGSYSNRTIPYDITNGFNLSLDEKIIKISTGNYHTVAISSNGRVFTWGYNYYGQLGDGTTINKSTPHDITDQFNLTNNETIDKITVGGDHSLVLTSNGRVYSWGRNSNDQLGIGYVYAGEISANPMEITYKFELSTDEKIIEINSKYNHSFAISSSGRIFGWGNNIDGQIGSEYFTVIEEISDVFNLAAKEVIIKMIAGSNHSLALTSYGNVYAWGSNLYGQLGDGTTTSSTTPINVTSQFNLSTNEIIVDIKSGYYHSTAITSSDNVYTWGRNDYSQLGDGTSDSSYEPKEITSQFNLTSYSLRYLEAKTFNYNETISHIVSYRSGYIFIGWYWDDEFTQPFDLETMPNYNIELYGKWEKI